jgi:hypothetical protein
MTKKTGIRRRNQQKNEYLPIFFELNRIISLPIGAGIIEKKN